MARAEREGRVRRRNGGFVVYPSRRDLLRDWRYPGNFWAALRARLRRFQCAHCHDTGLDPPRPRRSGRMMTMPTPCRFCPAGAELQQQLEDEVDAKIARGETFGLLPADSLKNTIISFNGSAPLEICAEADAVIEIASDGAYVTKWRYGPAGWELRMYGYDQRAEGEGMETAPLGADPPTEVGQ